MNICVVSPIYPIASLPRLGKFVHEQAKELVRQGSKAVVITIGDNADKDQELIDKVEVYRIKKKSRFFFSLFSFILMLRLHRRYNFGILHSHFVGFFTVICSIAAKLMKVPHVVTAHGIGILRENFLKRMYLFFPKGIVCVSRFVASLAEKYSDKEKVVFIPNGVDAEKLRPTKSVSQMKDKLKIKNQKVLLSVCGLAERKGLDRVIKALSNVVKKEPNIVYLIVGNGSEKENLVNLANKLGIKDKVVFIDHVPDGELANYYNVCDIFLLMSRTIKEKAAVEGFGIVYIEASFLGKPVIGGKSGGTSDAIEDGNTGFLIEPNNVRELERKIILLLKNKSLRDKLGKNGKKRVLKGFLWKHNVEKLVEVYKDLIKTY